MPKPLYGDAVSLDEKIEIFRRYFETNKEIDGKTIFEGFPIGRWAILLRAGINQGRNLSDEQHNALKELGLLDRVLDSTDGKIQKLVEWYEKYPKARIVNFEIYDTIENILREYATSDDDYVLLAKEYKALRVDYKYLGRRLDKGKLSTEQVETLREGNAGGVFGTPSYFEDLSKKYRINPEKIRYIVYKYGSMNSFFESYMHGKLDKLDIKILGKNLRMAYNISDLNGDRNLDALYQCVIEKDGKSNEFCFYDGEKLLEALNAIPERNLNIIKSLFDLNNGESTGAKEGVERIELSRARIYQIREEVLKELRHSVKFREFSICELDRNSNSEAIEQIKQRLFSSNVIFYPDSKYEKEKVDISEDELKEPLNLYEGAFKKKLSFEDLELSKVAYNSLKRLGITNVEELIDIDIENLINAPGLGLKSLKEVLKVKSKLKYDLFDTSKDSSSTPQLIEDVELSNRAYMALKCAGIDTLEQLAELSKVELKKIKGIGVFSRMEIDKIVEKYCVERSNEVDDGRTIEKVDEHVDLNVLKGKKQVLTERLIDLEERNEEANELLEAYNSLSESKKQEVEISDTDLKNE